MWKCGNVICRITHLSADRQASTLHSPLTLFAAIFFDKKTSYKIQYSFNYLYHPILIYNLHSINKLVLLKENELCALCGKEIARF
jgi:hypothetical protein